MTVTARRTRNHASFARHARSYDLLSGVLARRLYRRVVADVSDVGLPAGSVVLDVGTGPGRVPRLTRDTAVLEEAQALARERRLPEDWFNPNAGIWMPPLPGGVLDQPAEPGLRVTYADDGFLLATKLIAQRAKTPTTSLPWPSASGSRPPHPSSSKRTFAATTPTPHPWSLLSTALTSTARSACSPTTPPGCFTTRGLRPSATSTPLKRARTPKPSGFGAASRARNALPGPHVTPRAADPPGSADDGSCLERGVRGFPSSPRSHARSPVGDWDGCAAFMHGQL
jgi:hypothetical protein